MESIIAQNEDVLVAPLDFSVGGSAASYIVSREQATYFSTQNLVSPQGVKIAKYQIGGNGFLDLSSLYFTALLTNKSSSAALQPLTAEAHCLFKRLIVRVAGTLVESIELFNLSEEYVRRLLPLEKRMNLAGMFLGADPVTGTHGYDLLSRSLAKETSKRIMFRPMTSAVLNMKKYFPALLLGAQGLTFELELAPADEACLSTGSQDYELSDLRILVDTVQLTSELTDQYTSLLLSGKSVFLNLDLHENTQHFLPGNSAKWSVSSARQFSRLNTLVVIFQQAPGAEAETKQVNNFFLPASAKESIETNLVINGERQPLFNNRGISEHWVRFLKGTGVMPNIGTSTSISFDGFGGGSTPGRAFSIVFDLEKLPSHAEHTGKPIDSGGVVTLHVEGVGTQASEYVDRAILQHSFSGMLEIRDSGCTLYT